MNCYYLYKGVWYSEQSILNLLKNGELKDVYSRGVANIPSLTKAVSSERVEKVEQIKEKQDGINGDERTEEVQGEQLQLGEKPEDQVTKTGEKTAEAGAAEEVVPKEFVAKSRNDFKYHPIDEIDKFKEHDRAKEPKFNEPSILDELTEDIRKNGITTPITLQVDHNGKGLVVEGNTRLAAAKRLGIKNIPVTVIRKEFGSINKKKAKKLPIEGFTEITPLEPTQAAIEPLSQPEGQIVQPEEKVAETGEKNEIDDGATDGGFDGENADIPKLFKQYLLDNGYEIDTERYDVIEGTKEVTDESQESMINRIRDDEEIQMLETVVISYDERYKSFIKETKPYYMFGKSYSSSAKPVITYGYLGMSDYKIEKISPAITTEKEGTPQAKKRQQTEPTSEPPVAEKQAKEAEKTVKAEKKVSQKKETIATETAQKVEKEPTKVAEIAKEEPTEKVSLTDYFDDRLSADLSKEDKAFVEYQKKSISGNANEFVAELNKKTDLWEPTKTGLFGVNSWKTKDGVVEVRKVNTGYGYSGKVSLPNYYEIFHNGNLIGRTDSYATVLKYTLDYLNGEKIPTAKNTKSKIFLPSNYEIDKQLDNKLGKEEPKVVKATGIKPTNLRDVYKAGRDVFGLNKAQSLAQAVVVDNVIGKIAKRRGVTKEKVYSEIEFRKSTMEDLSPDAKNLYQEVWHGSPYEFEKFRLDKIGTGEGAQAFGWGLYFTDKKSIAEGYAKLADDAYSDLIDKLDEKTRNKLESNPVFKSFVGEAVVDDVTGIKTYRKINSKKALNFFNETIKVLDQIKDIENKLIKNNSDKNKLKDLKDSIRFKFGENVSSQKTSEIKKQVQELIDSGIFKEATRNLYKVKLHGDRSIDEFNYLRWDKKPTKEAMQNILNGLTKEQYDKGFYYGIAPDADGAKIYKQLSRALGSDKEASLYLLKQGIDGIKYPTEITRKGTHEESFNYVIFDENVAEIEEHIKFQKQGNGKTAKGAIQFLQDGSAIIHALTDPNVSTPLHEIAHLYEKYMTTEERQAVLNWTGDKTWTVTTSEKFARGFENYLATGKAPRPSLQKVFDRFKKWLTEIYNGITGSEIDIELNDAMRDVYAAMLGEDVVPKVSKKAARQKRFEEIDIELGNELENLAESLGIVKKLTGEQRAKLLSTVVKVSKLLAEKYALKGEELIDEIVEYFRGKNIELDEEILKEVRDAETQQGRPLQDSGDETGEGRGKRDSDLSEVNRPVVQDWEKDEEKVRQFGKKVSESTILSPDLKKNVIERGIGYLPRGRKITEAEARELIRIYDELGGMDRVKAEIMSPDFRVNGDTRIAMATIYVNDRIAKSKTETDHIKAEQYKTDAADILEFYVNRSTGVAQELEGMKMWNKVIGTHPDFIAETVRSTVAKQNAEFYDTYSNDIAAAKKIIDDFINSKDFKEKYAPKKETPAARKQRGMNKIASGIDKLATLRGIRFQAVPESDMPTSEYEALKEIASGILDVGIASVEELIAELKTQTRRYFSPSEIDKVSRRIVNDIDAKNNLKKKTVKIKLDKTDEEQLIDKLFKSMAFATRKQLKQLVADNIELLQEKGLIDDRSFRELIAKAVGRYYVSEKQIQSVEKAAKVINDAKNIEKNIDNLFDDYMKATEEKNKPEIQRLKKEVDRQLKEYKKAMLEAGIASSEIGSVFADSPTLVKMFATFIQGNLLTPASLKVNLLANLLVSPVRLARNSMAVGLDMLLSEVGSIAKERLQKVRDPYWREVLGKMLSEERTFTSTALNAGLIRGFASGTKEGIVQMWKGQSQDDITNRDVSKALKPLMAWYDLYQAATGREKLRMNEVVQKFVEGTFGIPPEIMFRFLNLGDKPFRRAAEQARLDELAGIKKKGIIKDFLTRVATDNGLDGDALKEFVKNPDKESLKDAEDYFESWKTKFMIRPDEESWEQARKAGLEAVYQQDNVLSNALKGIQKATTVKTGIDTLDKIISSVSRFVFVANIPFVKTPTNVMIETLEYAVPVIPFARAMLFDAPKGDRRAFVKNMSKAIVGTSINTAVGALFGMGIMGLAQGGGDDEPKERVSTEVKAAEYYYRPPYYMNTRAMADLWSNIVYGTDKDLSWKDGDTMQQYTRYGLPSAVLMAHAQGYAGMKPEEIKQLGLWDRQLLFTMPALKAGLDQSYVKNISALINALKGDEYEQESYLVGLAKATEASVLPNSYRAYQQAKDNYIRETRMATLQGKERIGKSITNDFATSYNIGKMPPPRVSIWGEDVERYQDGKSPLFRVFDISKDRTYGNGFGIELFNLYTKTQNNDVLPPDVPNRIKVLDDYVKVDGELYHDLVQYSAGKHKMVVSAIMNSDAWKQLPNDAAKVEFISDVYKGKVNGIDIPTRSDFTREFVNAHRDQFIELYKKQHGVERYEKLKRGTE